MLRITCTWKFGRIWFISFILPFIPIRIPISSILIAMDLFLVMVLIWELLEILLLEEIQLILFPQDLSHTLYQQNHNGMDLELSLTPQQDNLLLEVFTQYLYKILVPIIKRFQLFLGCIQTLRRQQLLQLILIQHLNILRIDMKWCLYNRFFVIYESRF